MKTWTISNGVYDFLKKFVTTYFPAAVTLFNVIVMAWGWDLPIEAINATCSGLEAFLGVILGITSANYKRINEGADLPHKEGTNGDEC